MNGLMTAEQAIEQALQHHQTGRLQEAERLYRQVLASDPRHPDALHLLGTLAYQVGRADAAEQLIRQAIALSPQVPTYHSNLGHILVSLNRASEAADACRRAVELAPEYPEAQNNLAAALRAQGKLDEAESHCRRALTLRPDFAEATENLGNIGRLRGDLVGAVEHFRRAIALKPDFAEAHLSLAMVLLVTGRFEQGWKEYEWRYRCAHYTSPRRQFAQPRWDGSELGGRTILVHAEQGFGDTIQFARYLPMVTERGGRVILETHPEVATLLSRVRGAEQVLATGQPLPPFDVHCPLMSLPGLFGTTLANIPAECPYLIADPVKVEQWRARLSQYDGFKLGLSWAGRPTHPNDRDRSMSPAMLAPLAQVSGVRFISLQKGPAATHITEAPQLNLIDLTQHIDDFSDTAALIANLDLIISVDTAVVHLAGALARPVWTLLPFCPDWRWLMNRADSPWYPTMRLFRQDRPGDWPVVVSRVTDALRSRAAER